MPTPPYNGGQAGVGHHPRRGDRPTGRHGERNGHGFAKRRCEPLQLRLGPTFYWDLSRRLAAGERRICAWARFRDYLFDETIVLADGSHSANNGRIGTTDTLYGGYANAMLTYHAQPNADIFFFFHFMTLGTSTIGGEGRQARLDLGS